MYKYTKIIIYHIFVIFIGIPLTILILGHLQWYHGVCAGVGMGPSPEGDHRVGIHTDTSLHRSHACPIYTSGGHDSQDIQANPHQC